MEPAKKYRDRLKEIQGNVANAYKYFKKNYDNYHAVRSFVFESNLTDDQISNIQELRKPPLQFNTLEAYISRLRGEFSKQEPSFKVSPGDGMTSPQPQLIQFYEGHMRAILDDTKASAFEYNIYTDQLSGGFSVMKVWTDYESENSFNQKIYLGRVFEPTLCGFDPLAQLPHKGDGNYCFELFPLSKDDFKRRYQKIDIDNISFARNPAEIDGINWYYQDTNTDIVLLCDYYEKIKKRVKLIEAADGKIYTDDEYKKLLIEYETKVAVPPIIKQERWTEKTTVCRFTFIYDKLLDYVETDFKYLPLIFVDGNSLLLRQGNQGGAMRQLTRAYVQNALDAQRLKNFAGQTLASEIENMIISKYMVAKESIPPEYLDNWTFPQRASTLVYNAFNDDDPSQPLPQPTPIVRAPIPPEIPNTFVSMDQAIQNILGSYDAQLGINDNQLSGVAIVEAATQSNSTAMPYIVNFLNALNQAAIIILDLIPKYYITPRTVPVVYPDGSRGYQVINNPNVHNSIMLNQDEGEFNVKVEAGVNFEVQKSRSLQTLSVLGQTFPAINSMINQMGLPIIFDNLDIRGADQLKLLAEQFTKKQQMQQQNQPPNPLVMRNQIEQQKLAQQNQHKQIDAQLEQAKLQLDAQKLENERLKTQLQYFTDSQYNHVQAAKATSEIVNDAAQTNMKNRDMAHRHAKDVFDHEHKNMELLHTAIQANNQSKEAPEST